MPRVQLLGSTVLHLLISTTRTLLFYLVLLFLRMLILHFSRVMRRMLGVACDTDKEVTLFAVIELVTLLQAEVTFTFPLENR